MTGSVRDRALAGVLCLPLAVLVVLAVAVRPITDDLCYEAAVRAEGVLSAWELYLRTWSGTWLQHGLSVLVAAPGGFAGYAFQALALLGLLGLACWLLAERQPLPALGLCVSAVVALQGSLVGPAYPGLAGAFAFPAAGLLHLLPVLLSLPLTARWAASGPPGATGLLLAVLLTGTGTAEAAAVLLVWLLLALRARADRRVLLRWLVPATVLAMGLTAVYLSPGSRSRAAQLALQPSSAALDNGLLVDLAAYTVLYTGGLLTSPGVWLALLLGLALGLRPPRPADLVVVAFVPALLAAQAAAGVFAYPAFWHLQGLQVAGAAAAFVLGGVVPLPRPGLRPVLLLVGLMALLPAGLATAAVLQRAEVVDAARVEGRQPGYALGDPAGATLPDAGQGAEGYASCWTSWTGASSPPAPVDGPRGVWPAVPVGLLG